MSDLEQIRSVILEFVEQTALVKLSDENVGLEDNLYYHKGELAQSNAKSLLTLLNGVFAMSELALASSRKARLTAMAEAGDKGAQAALNLLDNPTQFLSSVQVGITSIGMLNGIVGEAAFSSSLGRWLQTQGMTEAAASVTATALVVTAITFIIGWLAIAGVPPFAGFWSKDEILLYTYAKSPVLYVVGLVTALLTAFLASLDG